MNEKIVISIASYRESELENTIKSFYSNAKFPDRLLFSIVSQDYEDIDTSYILPKNLSYVRTAPEKSRGVSWARALAASAFSNYDYFFQIDGHMLASPEWDVALIRNYQELQEDTENKKLILTSYPASYVITPKRGRVLGVSIGNSYPELSGVRYREWPIQVGMLDAIKYKKVFYIQAACMFCAKNFIEEVPFDPEVDFFAEEIILSIRAFSRGYSIYAFNSPIFYHMYAPDRKAAQIDKKPMTDGNPLTDVIFDRTRADKIMSGEIDDVYGLTAETIEDFASITGYVLDLDHE